MLLARCIVVERPELVERLGDLAGEGGWVQGRELGRQGVRLIGGEDPGREGALLGRLGGVVVLAERGALTLLRDQLAHGP